MQHSAQNPRQIPAQNPRQNPVQQPAKPIAQHPPQYSNRLTADNANKTSLGKLPSHTVLGFETINEIDEKVSSEEWEAFGANWIRNIRMSFKISNFVYVFPFEIDRKIFNIEVSFQTIMNPKKKLHLGLKILHPQAEEERGGEDKPARRNKLITIAQYNFRDSEYTEEDLNEIITPKSRYFPDSHTEKIAFDNVEHFC